MEKRKRRIVIVVRATVLVPRLIHGLGSSLSLVLDMIFFEKCLTTKGPRPTLPGWAVLIKTKRRN